MCVSALWVVFLIYIVARTAVYSTYFKTLQRKERLNIRFTTLYNKTPMHNCATLYKRKSMSSFARLYTYIKYISLIKHPSQVLSKDGRDEEVVPHDYLQRKKQRVLDSS